MGQHSWIDCQAVCVPSFQAQAAGRALSVTACSGACFTFAFCRVRRVEAPRWKRSGRQKSSGGVWSQADLCACAFSPVSFNMLS